MRIEVHGEIIKDNPTRIDISKAIDNLPNSGDEVRLFGNNKDYISVQKSYSGGYELTYLVDNQKYISRLDCIRVEAVKEIFDKYYSNNPNWKSELQWKSEGGETNIKKKLLHMGAVMGLFVLFFFKTFGRTYEGQLFNTIFNNSLGLILFILLFIVLGYANWESIVNFRIIINRKRRILLLMFFFFLVIIWGYLRII